MNRDLEVVDNELLNHLAMNFLAHSSSEAEAYSEGVAYSGAVVCSPCEVVVHPSFDPSFEVVDPSVGLVDHNNCRMMEIFPRV